MKKKAVVLLMLCALLCACAAAPDESAVSDEDALSNADAPAGFAPELLPASDDADEWTLSDFPGCFDGAWETEREELTLGEDVSVTVLRGAEEGAAVYVVAGIHGDEVAGWRAGALLKDACLRAGTLYIISPANAYGAAQEQRRTKDGYDLNRSFPGDENGSDTERLAAVIFGDIARRAPVLLFDLHEAHEKREGRDALGNSLICGSLEGDGDLVLEMLLASEEDGLCAAPLTLYSSPPQGSINRAATELLALPTITVETLRTEALSQRVRNHLEIVQFALQYLEML